jgi:hypothetical protein
MPDLAPIPALDEMPAILTFEDIAEVLGVKVASARRYGHGGDGRGPSIPPADFYVPAGTVHRGRRLRRRTAMRKRETVHAWLVEREKAATEARTRSKSSPAEAGAA